MNSSQDPTNEAHQRVLPPLRGHWQDCLAVTNILLIPSLALDRLILRLKSSLINEPVNSETQVPVFSWETGLWVLCRFCSQRRRHSQTLSHSQEFSEFYFWCTRRLVSQLWQSQRRYLCTDAAGSHKNLRCWLLLVCLPHGSDLVWMYDTLVGDRRNAWTNPIASHSRWGGLCLKPLFFFLYTKLIWSAFLLMFSDVKLGACKEDRNNYFLYDGWLSRMGQHCLYVTLLGLGTTPAFMRCLEGKGRCESLLQTLFLWRSWKPWAGERKNIVLIHSGFLALSQRCPGESYWVFW